MKLTAVLAIFAALGLIACSSSPDKGTSDTKTVTAQAAPTFTDEEKAQMTDEEKLAILNSTVEEKDQIICRKQQVTGSHKKKLVCRTVEQMEIEREQAKDAFRNAGVPGQGPGGN